MLLVMAVIDLGIHQRIPATSPPSFRSVKVALSFSTRAAASWVVVTQTLPTIGNRVETTGPDARSAATVAPGSRKNASLVKSTRCPIAHSTLTVFSVTKMVRGLGDASRHNEFLSGPGRHPPRQPHCDLREQHQQTEQHEHDQVERDRASHDIAQLSVPDALDHEQIDADRRRNLAH